MKSKIIIILLIFSLSFVSAMDITFYYSDSCSHCQEIKPFVMEAINYYPQHHFNIYEISKDKDNYISFLENGFEGVPAFKIKTDDCREIKFTGTNYLKLSCELQQMTTKQCPTYYDKSVDGSWFIN